LRPRRPGPHLRPFLPVHLLLPWFGARYSDNARQAHRLSSSHTARERLSSPEKSRRSRRAMWSSFLQVPSINFLCISFCLGLVHGTRIMLGRRIDCHHFQRDIANVKGPLDSHCRPDAHLHTRQGKGYRRRKRAGDQGGRCQRDIANVKELMLGTCRNDDHIALLDLLLFSGDDSLLHFSFIFLYRKLMAVRFTLSTRRSSSHTARERVLG
jgi:hypothetical protein